MAGIASLLGMHVPLPEVPADDSNPRGFSEPQWVVDLHDRAARGGRGPGERQPRRTAWFETGRICTREPARIRVTEWLEPHFDVHPELVVKDPRLSWFLGLWRVAAIRTGATPVFATMLRPPAEVVGSKQKYYANKLGASHLAASWLNMLLHTERATRESAGGARVFVRYEDLLTDWVKTTMHVGHALDLQTIIHTRSDQIREVHRFIDPTLRRVTADPRRPRPAAAAARAHRHHVGGAQQARRARRRHRRRARDPRRAPRRLHRPLRGGGGDQQVVGRRAPGSPAPRRPPPTRRRPAARPRRADPARRARQDPPVRTPRRAQGAGSRAAQG